MTSSKLVSRGTVYFAVISTFNLLIIMAAIANDGSESTSTAATPVPTFPSSSSRSPSSRRPTTEGFKTTTQPPQPLPTAASLVRGPEIDAVIKVTGGKDRSSSSGVGKPPPVFMDHHSSTLSSLMDLINSSSSTSPFITANWTEVKAQVKSNALLPCHVRNSGDGVTVSWIRRKDYHLLTVGLQTYSSDDRFQAIHAQSPDDWNLKIKYVQPRDSGVYECQVSTHPPSSIFVTVSVVEVRAEIVGGPEKFYKAGSTVELKCDLVDSTEEPEYVFWYQGLQMINYDSSRIINVTHYKSSSVLLLHNVQKSDTGNYSCVPSNAHPASIFVHIINGENPAAMQHGSHSTSCVPCPPLWFLSFLLSLTLQALYFRFMSNHVDRYHQKRAIPPNTMTTLSPPLPSSSSSTILKYRKDSSSSFHECHYHPCPHHNSYHLWGRSPSTTARLQDHHRSYLESQIEEEEDLSGDFHHHCVCYREGKGESHPSTTSTTPLLRKTFKSANDDDASDDKGKGRPLFPPPESLSFRSCRSRGGGRACISRAVGHSLQLTAR